MKHLVFFIIGLLLCSISACNTEISRTELRWQNSQNDTSDPIVEIKWMQDELTVDQTWNGSYSNGETTEFKEIDLLNAHGECSDGTFTYQISSDSESSFSLDEGISETIIIDTLTDITP